MDNIHDEIRLLDKNFSHKKAQIVRQIDQIRKHYGDLKRIYEYKRERLIETQESQIEKKKHSGNLKIT